MINFLEPIPKPIQNRVFNTDNVESRGFGMTSNLIENRVLQLGGRQHEIAIAGLGRYKPLSKLVGSGAIWNNAFEAMHNCKQIYIIGFSLSPFDTMARMHFGGIMMERSKKDSRLPLITLIDPLASELKSNFESVFGCDASIDIVEKEGGKVDWGFLGEC